MKKPLVVLLLVCAAIATFVPATWSQPLGGPPNGLRAGGPPGRFRGGPPRGPDGARGPNPMMELLDSDRDGTLTAEEIQASASVLLKCDRNGDGTLTPDEVGSREGGPRAGHGPNGPPDPPALGDVLPPHVRQHLQLNETQTAELNELQKEVKSRLASILDEEQLASVEEMLRWRPEPPPGGPEAGSPRRGRRGPGGPSRPPGPRGEE
jgi:EF hand